MWEALAGAVVFRCLQRALSVTERIEFRLSILYSIDAINCFCMVEVAGCSIEQRVTGLSSDRDSHSDSCHSRWQMMEWSAAPPRGIIASLMKDSCCSTK